MKNSLLAMCLPFCVPLLASGGAAANGDAEAAYSPLDCETSSPKEIFEKSVLFERPADDDHYRVPGLIQLPSGDILARALLKVGHMRDAGGKDETRFRISSDDGRTWTDVSDIPRSPILVDRTTSTLWSIGHHWPKKNSDGKPMSEDWMVNHSDKGLELGAKITIYSGNSTSTEWVTHDVTDQFFRYPGKGTTSYIGKGIQLEKGPHAGRLIMPGRCYGKKFERVGPDAHNTVVISDDHGATWRWGGRSQGYCGEACIVELSDGSVYMSNRNHDPTTAGWRSYSISRDGGETFTEFGVAADLPEGRCHAALARYNFPDQESDTPGRVLFLNPSVSIPGKGLAPHEGRKNMTVKLSYDDCRSWPVSKTIHAGKSGYSDVIVTKDGTVLCAFESGAEVYAEDITLVRFKLEWLESGFVPKLPQP